MGELAPGPGAASPGLEERELLRRSVRHTLEAHWSVEKAVAWCADADRLAAIWQQLADLGVTLLGADRQMGGLSEIAVVAEELGRAHCAAPILGSAVLNLAMRDERVCDGDSPRWSELAAQGTTRLGFAASEHPPGIGTQMQPVGCLAGRSILSMPHLRRRTSCSFCHCTSCWSIVAHPASFSTLRAPWAADGRVV